MAPKRECLWQLWHVSHAPRSSRVANEVMDTVGHILPSNRSYRSGSSKPLISPRGLLLPARCRSWRGAGGWPAFRDDLLLSIAVIVRHRRIDVSDQGFGHDRFTTVRPQSADRLRCVDGGARRDASVTAPRYRPACDH